MGEFAPHVIVLLSAAFFSPVGASHGQTDGIYVCSASLCKANSRRRRNQGSENRSAVRSHASRGFSRSRSIADFSASSDLFSATGCGSGGLVLRRLALN